MGRGATANDTQGKGKVEGKGGCSDATGKSSGSDSDSDAAEKPADLKHAEPESSGAAASSKAAPSADP